MDDEAEAEDEAQTLDDEIFIPFDQLTAEQRAEMATNLRPLVWLDGLIAATIISTEISEAWLAEIWQPGARTALSADAAQRIASHADDHYIHVLNQLSEATPEFNPYFEADQPPLANAHLWAAGFRRGIQVSGEGWGPILDDDGARHMVMAIFALLPDDILTSKEFEESPFLGLTPARREEMRHTSLSMLPNLIIALHDVSLAFEAFMNEIPEVALPRYQVGRNDPCPCGSGKKYKKCCLDRDPV